MDASANALERRLSLAARVGADACVVLGLVVLLGWSVGSETLKRIFPGFVAMNPATAVGMIMAGLSLRFHAEPRSAPARARAAVYLGVCVACLGMAKIASLLLGHARGIDTLLFAHALGSESELTNRMAPNTALDFVLVGAALALLDARTRRAAPAEPLALAAGLIALMAGVGYAYGVRELYGLAAFIPMALHTAMGFIVLSAGILLARPRRGLMLVVSGDGAGGYLARRLIPAVVVVPIALGWVRLVGERAGWYGAEFGVSLFAIATIALFLALVWFTAHLASRVERERAAADAERARAANLVRSIVENVPHAVVVKDPADLSVRMINRAGEALFGISRDDLVGGTVANMLPREQAAAFEAADRNALAGRAPGAPAEQRLRTRAGERFVRSLRIPVLDAGGSPWYLLAIHEDLSDRHTAAMARATFSTLVEQCSDAIIVVDTGTLVTCWNPAAERLFGVKADHAAGRPLADSLPPAAAGEVRALMDRALAGERLYAEAALPLPAGRALTVAFTLFPLRDAAGAITGVSALARDISGRRQADEDLRAARRAAEAASHAKSLFLANMSHEIRTPLNGVVGMTELLLDTPLDDQQRRFAELAKASAESLTALVNDILDFSKIEAGRMEIESIDFDPRAVAENATSLLALRARAKRLELACHVEPSVPPMLRGDPDRIRQVLVNLIGNAVKFTDSGAVVLRVSLESSGPGADILRFAVSDTGIGMPADRTDRLFRPFSQIDPSATRKFGGTGLGLAISRQLVELMGGAIGVQTAPGKGSTFWFTVRCQPAQAGLERRIVPRPDARRLRVLVADDCPQTLEVLCEQLRCFGMEVHSVPSVRHACESLRAARAARAPFGVAIVDEELPADAGASHEDLLAAAAAADTAIIHLSPLESCAAPVEGPAPAARLCKPVRQSQLFDSIIGAIASRRTPPAPDAGAPAPALRPAPSHAARILLVEDNEVNQAVAAEILRRAGFQCDVVSDGNKAVQAALTRAYDLVVMDCQMPVVDGFTATRAIRRAESRGVPASRAGGRIPIVALTAGAVKGDREKCLDAGMDAYTTKPVDPRELLRVIGEQLSLAARDAA